MLAKTFIIFNFVANNYYNHILSYQETSKIVKQIVHSFYHSNHLVHFFFFFFCSKLQNVFLSSNTETWSDRKEWCKRQVLASVREAKDVQRKQINLVANRQRPWRTLFTGDILHSQQKDWSECDLLRQPHILLPKQQQQHFESLWAFQGLVKGGQMQRSCENPFSGKPCAVKSWCLIRSEGY